MKRRLARFRLLRHAVGQGQQPLPGIVTRRLTLCGNKTGRRQDAHRTAPLRDGVTGVLFGDVANQFRSLGFQFPNADFFQGSALWKI